jgi:S-DNA-T family DNA segregation ATPase FtsK/SpoIIIE
MNIRIFVDDEEVEQITEYLRSTGAPEDISGATQQEEEDDSNLEHFDNDGTSDEALHKKALQITQTKLIVSINYTQQCFRIGYSKAAIIAKKMEHKSVISPPEHVRKREILLPED